MSGSNNERPLSHFERIGITYTKVGDYYIPDLVLPEQKEYEIGVWGFKYMDFLKKHSDNHEKMVGISENLI